MFMFFLCLLFLCVQTETRSSSLCSCCLFLLLISALQSFDIRLIHILLLILIMAIMSGMIIAAEFLLLSSFLTCASRSNLFTMLKDKRERNKSTKRSQQSTKETNERTRYRQRHVLPLLSCRSAIPFLSMHSSSSLSSAFLLPPTFVQILLARLLFVAWLHLIVVIHSHIQSVLY